MNRLYTKEQLRDYYHRYRKGVQYQEELNRGKVIPVKVSNINGLAGECLAYYLIKDGIIGKPFFGKIKSIDLKGNTKSGLGETAEGYDLGGDIVISNVKGKLFIVEIKSVTSDSLFTTKSTYNKNANTWVILDFSHFRSGGEFVETHIVRNMEKYSKTIHIDGNNQDKLNLKKDILEARNGNDYGTVLSINLYEYLSGDSNAINGNRFFSWS